VIATDLNPEALRKLLEANPYARFPVVQQNRLAGVLTRKEVERALRESTPPKVEPAISCPPHRTIRELQALLIDSTTLFAVVTSEGDGKVLGVLTLHDLLRAEMALGDGLMSAATST
jgi:CIC family chloride channel protein